jgi:hypothetical protein
LSLKLDNKSCQQNITIQKRRTWKQSWKLQKNTNTIWSSPTNQQKMMLNGYRKTLSPPLDVLFWLVVC